MATKIRPWASTGATSTPSNAKIDQGWVAGEQPPIEWENERMNVRDNLVNTVIDDYDDLTTRLQETTPAAVDGASYIGFGELLDSPDSIPFSTVRGAITYLLGYVNARVRKDVADNVTANHIFSGETENLTGSIGLKDELHKDYYACINSYSESGDRQGVANPYNKQTMHTVGSEHTDPCAIVDRDNPGKFKVVLLETDGSNLYEIDPVTFTTVTRAITGFAAGVTELSSACSDGKDIYVCVRRAAGTDTIACIDTAGASVDWEVNAPDADSFIGFPYDRIVTGNVISETPWEVELLVLSGNLTMGTVGVLRKIQSSDGATLWTNTAATSTPTKKPSGGLAHNGDEVVVTANFADATVPVLMQFNMSTGAYLNNDISMLFSGTPDADDAAHDICYDGNKYWWISRKGFVKNYTPARTDYQVEFATSTLNITGGTSDGWPIVFDGQNIWTPTFFSGTYRVNLKRWHPGRSYNTTIESITSLINNGNSWSPMGTPWSHGRGCRVGPHVVFVTAEPGNETARNTIAVIRNSALWAF